MIYTELPVVAAIVVYVVGVSGFTQSWRGMLARLVHIQEYQMRPIKPFDCPTCMTWWVCLAWAVFRHDFQLWTVAESAALSLLAIPMQDFMLLLREGLCAIFRIIINKL